MVPWRVIYARRMNRDYKRMAFGVFERVVHSARDMAAVERAIVSELGGENNRCAFLRSMPYIRLRLAALYPSHPGSAAIHTAQCGDLSVTLTHTTEGPLVRVCCLADPVYPEEFLPQRDPPCPEVGLEKKGHKRPCERGI